MCSLCLVGLQFVQTWAGSLLFSMCIPILHICSSYMASFIINSIPPAVVGLGRTKVYISFFFPFTYYELDGKNTTLLCRTAFILVYLQKTAQIIVNMLFWKTKLFICMVQVISNARLVQKGETWMFRFWHITYVWANISYNFNVCILWL